MSPDQVGACAALDPNSTWTVNAQADIGLCILNMCSLLQPIMPEKFKEKKRHDRNMSDRSVGSIGAALSEFAARAGVQSLRVSGPQTGPGED